MIKVSPFAAIFVLLAGVSAFAATPSPNDYSEVVAGLSETYDSFDDIAQAIDQGLVNPVAQTGLNALVAEGIQRLRDAGELDLANKFEGEWKTQFSNYLLTGLGTLELGDYDPLSPWLANFYAALFEKTRGVVKGIRILHDINAMNYALGVILKPKGPWRKNTDYDRIEYRKHFIPFANIVTYWVTLGVCNRFFPNAGQICGMGAGQLEHYMGRYLAPQISDKVFSMVTGQSNPATPRQTFVYTKEAFEGCVLGNRNLCLKDGE